MRNGMTLINHPLLWMGNLPHQLVGGLSLLFIGFYPSQVVQEFDPQYGFLSGNPWVPSRGPPVERFE